MLATIVHQRDSLLLKLAEGINKIINTSRHDFMMFSCLIIIF